MADELPFELTPDVTLRSSPAYAGVGGNYPYFSSGYVVMGDYYNGVLAVRPELEE